MLEGQLGSLHKSTGFPCWRHNSQLEWFFLLLSDLWCGGKGIAMYVLERAGHGLCLQLIAKSNFGRAFGNICHLTCCQCFLFFTFILPSYLAKQFMPNNPYFRNPGHFWYDFTFLKQSLHQFISQYLPAGTFLLMAKLCGFFLLSLSHGLCRELHLPSMVFLPHPSCDLEIWRLCPVAIPSPVQATVWF